ncbi:alpha/beta hydrolase [Lentibacter algarum]|uniref:alpha/beta hydrolase n=1 Tax=Lentibacter algarum TaxID=576131 RepID=UPI001C06DF00|nr:alpha/beta hydrolase [Lentibacter algarum]MBU2980812.1 alpha/beta hydrolase [Lentibacter algarum]
MLTEAPFFNEMSEGPEKGRAFWIQSFDDKRLRVGYWEPQNAKSVKGTVLLFPGRTEYIEKYGRTAKALADDGFATLAIDWRGQGLADRLTDDRMLGYVGKFADYQLDVKAVLAAAKELGAPEPYHLLAHSMGGCIGLRALHDGLPVASAVFSAPMWGIKLAPAMRPVATVLAAVTSRLGIGARLAPGTSATTYVLDAPFEGNSLTTDPEMWDYMKRQAQEQPKLTLAGPSLHWLHEALVECKALAALPAPTTRTLTFLGTNERIVDAPSVHVKMSGWSNGTLQMVEGAEHEVLMETSENRSRIHAQILAFFQV